jgi:hypothetical protein
VKPEMSKLTRDLAKVILPLKPKEECVAINAATRRQRAVRALSDSRCREDQQTFGPSESSALISVY